MVEGVLDVSSTSCRWLRPDEVTGFTTSDGLTILGQCGLLGGTAYDKRCEICADRAEREGRA